MSRIHPFKAWRPTPELVEEVACVPYDVIDTEEARVLAEGRPRSFLHVIRPEICLEASVDIYSEEVYQEGREQLHRLIQEGSLIQEQTPCVYVYRLIMNGRSQTGLFTCVSVQEYDHNLILKHELTRPDKEDDRTKHILTQEAHAEPVMLTYRGTTTISHLTSKTMLSKPLYDFTAVDGIQHTLWKVDDSKAFVDAFQEVEALYVADGHHRCKSASRAAEALRDSGATGEEEVNFFPAVLFPMEEMMIMPYNRVIFKAGDKVLDRLAALAPLRSNAPAQPVQKGDISVYYRGTWYGFSLPAAQETDPVSALDASRLQDQVLSPLFGIDDPRTSKNIAFVGGIRGTAELVNLVDSGKAELAFSMYPTSIQELLDVSDAGQLMPPKSTWFEPKLRSGLLIHTF